MPLPRLPPSHQQGLPKLTWEEGDDSLLGILLATFDGKLIQKLHLRSQTEGHDSQDWNSPSASLPHSTPLLQGPTLLKWMSDASNPSFHRRLTNHMGHEMEEARALYASKGVCQSQEVGAQEEVSGDAPPSQRKPG